MYGLVLCMKKLHFVSRNWLKEISSVACGLSSINKHYSVNILLKCGMWNVVTVCFAAIDLVIVLAWLQRRQRHNM